ncbi:hypothetical protein ACFL20_05350 [Spirochaetota bacterium]
MLKKHAEEIYKKIVSSNSQMSQDSIPHSDEFIPILESSLGISAEEINEIIRLLKDAHKVFIIEIVREDDDRGIKRVEGYIDADTTSIRKLKNYFQASLVARYEEETQKKQSVHVIIKEIFPKMNIINNTPLGHIANKAIMLEEFEKLTEKHFHVYSESWKKDKFEELIKEREGDLTKRVVKTENQENKESSNDKKNEQPSTGRAIDSKEYSEFNSTSRDQSLNKVLQIYGVEFFFRVNLRKYNFNYIREIVDSKHVFRKSELQLLKNMIQKLRDNFVRDEKLSEYKNDISELERAISRNVSSVRR